MMMVMVMVMMMTIMMMMMIRIMVIIMSMIMIVIMVMKTKGPEIKSHSRFCVTSELGPRSEIVNRPQHMFGGLFGYFRL